MKRLLMALLFIASWAVPQAWAASGNITTNASTCALTTTCLVVNLPQDKGGSTLTLSGTWTGTISFEATGDGGATWVAVSVTPLNSSTTVTSATGNGTWQVNVSGFTGIRMRGSATMSGSALATINPSAASARGGAGGGGGGSGTVTSIATTSPLTGGTITATGTIGCPTCTVAGTGYYVGQYVGGGTFTMSAGSTNKVQGVGISLPAWTFSNIIYLVSTTDAADAVYGAALVKLDGTAVCHTTTGVQLTANGTGTSFPCAEGSVTIPAGNYVLLTTGGSSTGALSAVTGNNAFTFYYNLTVTGCTATSGVFSFSTPCSITPATVLEAAGPPLFMLH